MQSTSVENQVAALAEELRRLRDHEEIRQAMYAYARGIDRGDQSLLQPSFHDDAEDDHGNFKGDKAAALAAFKKSAANKQTTASFHHLGNVLIDLKGDVADVETYFVAVQRRELDGKTYTRTRAGRYLDRFERRDGVWRVARRKVIDDWNRLDEVVQVAAEIGPDNHLGTRDLTDPSYAVEGFMDRYKSS